MDLFEVVRLFLKALCDPTKETAHLPELSGSDGLYLDNIESSMSIGMGSRVETTKPSYCTELRKILLAFRDEDEQRRLLDQIYTFKTIIRRDVLMAQLTRYQEQGYPMDNEEGGIGLFCIARPIFDISGKVIAAISIAC